MIETGIICSCGKSLKIDIFETFEDSEMPTEYGFDYHCDNPLTGKPCSYNIDQDEKYRNKLLNWMNRVQIN